MFKLLFTFILLYIILAQAFRLYKGIQNFISAKRRHHRSDVTIVYKPPKKQSQQVSENLPGEYVEYENVDEKS